MTPGEAEAFMDYLDNYLDARKAAKGAHYYAVAETIGRDRDRLRRKCVATLSGQPVEPESRYPLDASPTKDETSG